MFINYRIQTMSIYRIKILHIHFEKNKSQNKKKTITLRRRLLQVLLDPTPLLKKSNFPEF